MERKVLALRKRRTRQHVIADQSVNYVERFIIDEGHTTQRMERDYGYDLLFFTFDEQGYCEPDFLSIQLKASDSLPVVGGHYTFDVDIRDYNLWMLERMPVILILFDASRRRAFWLCVQSYFNDKAVRRPKKGAKTVRMRIPLHQKVSRRAVATLRRLKWAARAHAFGGDNEAN